MRQRLTLDCSVTNTSNPKNLNNFIKLHKAFTLAEVLITLGVIGIVAAITLPSFIGNYQTKVRKEQNRMVQYKLTKATDLMKSHGKIGNYNTTKDFVNELKKYFKIAQICENNNLEQCWPTKVIATDGSEVKVSDIKDGTSLNPTGWTKETMGIITADGTPMILTYKDDCPALDAEKTYMWQTEDNKPVTNATASCIAAIYDLNGKSRPNKSGVDVRLFNATQLGSAGLQCYTWTDMGGNSANDKTGGLCLSGYVVPDPAMTYGTPEYIDYTSTNNLTVCPADEYHVNCEPDQWVGAYKTCDEAGGRLPSLDELTQIANSMYHTNETDWGATIDVTLYEDPFSLEGVTLWSSENMQYHANFGESLGFYMGKDEFYYYQYGRYNEDVRTRCVLTK